MMNKDTENLATLLLECQKQLGKDDKHYNNIRLWWKIECHPLIQEWRKKHEPEFNTDTPCYQGRVWEQI